MPGAGPCLLAWLSWEEMPKPLSVERTIRSHSSDQGPWIDSISQTVHHNEQAGWHAYWFLLWATVLALSTSQSLYTLIPQNLLHVLLLWKPGPLLSFWIFVYSVLPVNSASFLNTADTEGLVFAMIAYSTAIHRKLPDNCHRSHQYNLMKDSVGTLKYMEWRNPSH